MTMFLGLQVQQDSTRILLHQGKYGEDMLEKFGFKDSKIASTLMAKRLVLAPDPDGGSVDQTEYRSMIGSLMYLNANIPDIMFVVCQYARYQANPKLSHLIVVKRIFSNYGGCDLDRKSTSGECQFLGGRLVSWQCNKQQTMSTSTAEAEYVATSACCSQVIWIQHQLLDYSLNFLETSIFCDNDAALQIAKNLGSQRFRHGRRRISDEDYKKWSTEFKKGFVGCSIRISHALRSNSVIYKDLITEFWKNALINKLGEDEVDVVK
ncbi:uncharacterized mitochondrial protein AtMg00810-like [Lactuca sativa]|uniref:uncharacterized mitochondrial protein AtMg00810-like n=1 Tax=Lactuca sativa TaxID=4236 RepID=UPI000CD88264|nr:uncharacterized mitochondrial protein AtMg00810-like [Lactuca sativa]